MTIKTTPDIKILNKYKEHYAAGFFEQPDAAMITRTCRACRRWFENRDLLPYDNQCFFPAGTASYNTVMRPCYSFSIGLDLAPYEAKTRNLSTEEKQAFEQTRELILSHTAQYFRHFDNTPHLIGGTGFTHAIINYGRVLREGLDEYQQRIEKKLGECSIEQKAFYEGLLDVLIGIRLYHKRIVEHLENYKDTSPNAVKLIEAFSQVPFKPAENYYQAMVCYNFMYYLDMCDNPGRIDQELFPYFQKDDSVSHDKALELMREFVDNVCATQGWSSAIGGSNADGTPAYNEITEICIEASHNKFRPTLELRVRDDMPEKLWQLSAEALATGCGQPAFYNETAYVNAIKSAGLGVTDEDVVKWNGGGCTETMIHGCSNVGSLDAGMNMLLILENTLHKTKDDATFEDILETYKSDVEDGIKDVTRILNKFFVGRAEHTPHPIRTLFMDDCIDNGKDFNDGGARYNWSVINIAGIANVVDSLQAIRQLVFEKKQLSISSLVKIMQDNFKDNEVLRQQLLACDKFGNDLDSVDLLAVDIATFTYKTLTAQECVRGKFIPSHILFEAYATAGEPIGATADGRFAHIPISDSSGPMQGNDVHGPTAMLKSVSKLPLHLAWGTPVLNIKVAKEMTKTGTSFKHIQNMVKTYFKMGGMQLQISVLDRKELLDALENPKAHEDIIVRIGGYSTYFNWLSDALKTEVIKRTEYIV